MNVDIIGKGFSFPLKPKASGKMEYQSGDEKIKQSIWIILSTAPGERVMMPRFGCGIHELLFEANTASLRGLVQQKVRESITRWEPRIDVIEVKAETPPDARNYLLIRIDYRVRSNNAIYNLVYPFFLREGAG